MVRIGLSNQDGTKTPSDATQSGMHVEEAEDLRLGKPEGVQHGARLERAVLGQVYHELHAHCPVARMMAFGKAEVCVQLLSDGSDGAVADNGQGRVDVHAGHESLARLALLIQPLVQ